MQMLLSVLMKVQGRNQGGLVSVCSINMLIVALAVLVVSELPTGLSCTQRQSILVRCKFYAKRRIHLQKPVAQGLLPVAAPFCLRLSSLCEIS